MAAFQNFRSALNGFNREDVVHYIEYINNKHTSQVNQLQTDIQALREELAAYSEQPAPDPEQITQLEQDRDAALSELEAVKAELVQVKEQLAAAQHKSNNELEAYRRAERAERVARERVTQLYEQANGALADATVRTDETATHICDAADRLSAQLTELQDILRQGKLTMKDAATTMYAIRPIPTEE